MTPERSRGVAVVAAVVLVAMGANWVAAVAQFQVNGLFSDQWSFHAPRFAEADWWTLFSWQHGPHRQGLGFVLAAWVGDASGWDRRVESLGIVAGLAGASALALGLKHRLTGRIQYSDIWIPLSGLSLLQYETVLLVPNASHSVMPLFMLMLGCHLLVGSPSTTRLVGVGLVAGLAIFTGFGIFVAAGLGGGLLWWAVTSRSHRRGAVAGLLVLLVAAAGFARGYVFAAASEGFKFPPDSAGAVLKFMGLMLASRMGVESTAGPAVVLGLAVGGLLTGFGVLAWRGRRDDHRAGAKLIGVVLVGVGVAFMGFTMLGRVHLGEIGAMASRYTTLVVLVWWGLDVFVAGVTSAKLRGGVAALGWVMALGPLLALSGRPVSQWVGTAGLRDGDVVNLRAFEQRKLAWIAELTESGDWREAERLVPNGVFPAVESLDLDRRLPWMEERGLSFYRHGISSLRWLPWAPGDDVIWWRPRSGGPVRLTPEGGRWFVAGQTGGYLNLGLEARTAGPVELEWDGRRSPLDLTDQPSGISLPASSRWTPLKLDGIRRAELPRWSQDPLYPIWSWYDGAWSRERGLRIEAGFYGWESEGPHGWTSECLRARVVAKAPSFLNVVIESRFDPVSTGHVILRMGDVTTVVPWSDGPVRFSVAIPTSADGQILQLVNQAGARSPAEMGWWDDDRALALRLTRLSVDAAAAYPVLKLP